MEGDGWGGSDGGGMEGRDGGDEGRDGGGWRGGVEGDGGEGWRGREWYWASSSFVVASLSCFVASFSPCPPRVSLLMCPCCHIVFVRVNGGRYFWMVVVVFVCGGHFSHPLLTDY